MEQREERKVIRISNGQGDTLEVELVPERDCLLGVVWIDGNLYHLEKFSSKWLIVKYCVDIASDYIPHCGGMKSCILLAPYSR